MTSTQVLNTQLIDGLVQTLLALSIEERQLLFRRFEEAQTRYEIRHKLHQYEQRYGLNSDDFYAQFMNGSLGDAEDYIEWAGFYEMLQPAEDVAQ
ncbi:MAG: hypothetical protein AAF609_10460 [Cyanobacteria bacterium P01_C01_bin.120]